MTSEVPGARRRAASAGSGAAGAAAAPPLTAARSRSAGEGWAEKVRVAESAAAARRPPTLKAPPLCASRAASWPPTARPSASMPNAGLLGAQGRPPLWAAFSWTLEGSAPGALAASKPWPAVWAATRIAARSVVGLLAALAAGQVDSSWAGAGIVERAPAASIATCSASNFATGSPLASLRPACLRRPTLPPTLRCSLAPERHTHNQGTKP